MNAAAVARPVRAVLLSVAGLVVWAGHFTAIYAASAVACERGLAERSVFGLPWISAMVGLATVVALALLALVLRPSLRMPAASVLDGGEAEPRFTRWFAGSTAVLAALGVVFQAVPVLLLPGCG
ncbi:hypothetical protein GXW78_11060 [Roseomonas terrae]|jgi:hypothetical protein|uniref:Uncharacterized protein n=1 Tax=Neoroseomonas terrae TaxID=424799 RepID=A0ABS5EGQ9_9PROT|nr:hypothetical protein [Neoroseomonas terrae]MBR0650204.1 hypothetical protein [Neoroseomonas terrae]